jgi:hypothetical protein
MDRTAGTRTFFVTTSSGLCVSLAMVSFMRLISSPGDLNVALRPGRRRDPVRFLECGVPYLCCLAFQGHLRATNSC